MNKQVSGLTVLFAMVISFSLIGLGMMGVDVTRLAHAFFGLVILVVALGVVFGFITSIFRP